MLDILRSVKFPSGHTLTVWDAGTRAPHGQWQLRYEFRAPASVTVGAVLFEGEDFGVSPLHAVDSDAALLALLAFLTLRPGDADPEYFHPYDGAQYTWTQSQACEALAYDVSVAEEAGGCACGYVWENLDGRTCADAPTVAEFEVLDHGEDGSQYFPGCGTAHTKFAHVATGVGDTAAEALEDALEFMVNGESTVSPLQERAMRESLADPDKSAFESLNHSECGEDHDGDDWHHYVSVRYNLRKES